MSLVPRSHFFVRVDWGFWNETWCGCMIHACQLMITSTIDWQEIVAVELSELLEVCVCVASVEAVS